MSNYLIVDNIVAGQTPNIEEPFLKILHEFDKIIEIGFHRGGLSLWLHKNKKIEDLNYEDLINKKLNLVKNNVYNLNLLNYDYWEEKILSLL